MLPERVVDTVVGVEEALDRLKLSYKERFSRFSPARIVPYRGYGNSDLLILRGRVLEDDETGFDPEPGLWTNIRNTIHRLESDEIRGARVRGRLGDCELEVTADDEAFFEFRFRPDQPISPGWQQVRLEIVEAMAEDGAGPVTGEVLAPPDDCDFIVVSDLYHRVACERPDRIRAVFIRDVTSPERDREVHRLADSLQERGAGIEAERRSEVPARSVRALLFG